MVLNVGDSAPDFELADPDLKMRTVEVSFWIKNWFYRLLLLQVLQFVRPNYVPFRDSWNEISNLGAQVVAISNDGPFANKAFAEKNNFRLPNT